MGIRTGLTRLTQFVLGFDGVLHLIECVTSWREEAWLTFGVTSFHTVVFFLAFYLVGHDHTHHKKSNDGESI
tara:strand:- start:531 stop:746 length:216 start_codon:yes stop_codon:yes gene_type:complete